MDTDRAPEGCSNPELGRLIHAYNLGDVLKEKDRTQFEVHMLTCDSCWEKYRQLEREK